MRRFPATWQVAIAVVAIGAFGFPSNQLAASSDLPHGKEGVTRELRQRSVLLIEADRPDLPAYASINNAFSDVLQNEFGERVEIYLEHLDLGRFNREGYLEELATWLRKKYEGRGLNTVVAMGPAAYLAVKRWREDLWPDLPVVFGGVDRRFYEKFGPTVNEAGRIVSFGHVETVEAALYLFPRTHNLVVVGGDPKRDPLVEFMTTDLEDEFAGRLEITDLTGLPLADILQRASKLPNHSVILVTMISADSTGRAMTGHEMCGLLEERANAPVFGWIGTFFGAGIVGGKVLDTEGIGRSTAELVGRVLDGADVAEIGVRESDLGRLVFDWRQMEKWRIPMRRLPAGSTIEFRPEPPWKEHPQLVASTLVIFVLQGALIIALARSRQRRLAINRDLHRLSGRLITAQEDERKRVARELHDDISQRLALLAIELESPGASEKLTETSTKVQHLAQDLHAIAHHLQPPRFESGGLGRALEAFCTEVATRHDQRFDCRLPESEFELPAEVALALYRVAQEAVQNAVKHSGADEISVELGVSPRWASVTVADNGGGVIRNRTEEGEGLGFAGMRERMRLVNGWLSIDTAQGKGTTVNAWAPIGSRQNEST